MHIKNTIIFFLLFFSRLTWAQELLPKNLDKHKSISVYSDFPAFLREGDRAFLTAKIFNNKREEISGKVQLQIIDATTGTTVDGWFVNSFPVQYFTAAGKDSAIVHFPAQVPYGFNQPIQIFLKAIAGNYTDSIQKTMLIFTNRALIEKKFTYTFSPKNGYNTIWKDLNNANDESISNITLTAQIATQPIFQAKEILEKLSGTNSNKPLQLAIQIFTEQLLKYQQKLPACKNLTLQKTFNTNKTKPGISTFETVYFNGLEHIKSMNIKHLIEHLQTLQHPNGCFTDETGKEDKALLTAKIIYLISKIFHHQQTDTGTQTALFPIIQHGNRFLRKSIAHTITENEITTALFYCVSQILLNKSFPVTTIDTALFHQLKKQTPQFNLANQALMAGILQQYNDTGLQYKNILQTIVKKAIEQPKNNTLSRPSVKNAVFSLNALHTQIQIVELLQNTNEKKFLFIQQILPKAMYTMLLQIKHNHYTDDFLMAQAIEAILKQSISLAHPIQLNLGNTSYSVQNNCVIEMGGNRLDTSFSQITILPPKNEKPILYGYVQWKYLQDVTDIPVTSTGKNLTFNKKIFVQTTHQHAKGWTSLTENKNLHVGDTILIILSIQNKEALRPITITDNYPACIKVIKRPHSSAFAAIEQNQLAGYRLHVASLPNQNSQIQYMGVVTQPGQYSSGIASLASEPQTHAIYAPATTLSVAEN
ncbi:hypothetical protein [Hydrotalea sp.]|uniref:alpha-2-macroglobulin family protein n=2 Tax=Hydrotalea sp. TaxID=2881279 RepID=UPI0026165762|nr:hypothetical protein [Hydrotalea sp.]